MAKWRLVGWGAERGLVKRPEDLIYAVDERPPPLTLAALGFPTRRTACRLSDADRHRVSRRRRLARDDHQRDQPGHDCDRRGNHAAGPAPRPHRLGLSGAAGLFRHLSGPVCPGGRKRRPARRLRHDDLCRPDRAHLRAVPQTAARGVPAGDQRVHRRHRRHRAGACRHGPCPGHRAARPAGLCRPSDCRGRDLRHHSRPCGLGRRRGAADLHHGRYRRRIVGRHRA